MLALATLSPALLFAARDLVLLGAGFCVGTVLMAILAATRRPLPPDVEGGEE